MSTPTTPPTTPPPPRGGRRVATRDRRRPTPDTGAVTALVLVLLAAAAVGLTRAPDTGTAASPGAAPRAGSTPAPADAGLVDRTLLACPETPAQARGEARAGLADLPGLAGLDTEGAWLLGDPGTTSSAPVPARGATRDLGDDTVLEAEGPAAAGVFASRVDASGRALAVAACAAPRASWWFAGAGSSLDHASVLSLANVDPGPVVLDIRVLSTDGEVETVGTRGITLGPGETRDLPLGDVAPPGTELAVAVQATRGRVAAAVSDRVADGPAAPEGLEWLPAAQEPSRVVHLAGLPGDSRGRTLLLANPSELEALVDVEVSGPRGTFTPVAARTVPVPPGSVVSVDAAALVEGVDVASLRIRSQVPVVATLRSRTRADHAYAGAVQPLTEPAFAPVVRGTTGRLQLGAGRSGATVSVTAWTAEGRRLDTDRVEVDPGATVEVPLPRRADYVLVTPDRGAVRGAVAYAGTDSSSVLPLVPLAVRLDLPVVVPGPL